MLPNKFLMYVGVLQGHASIALTNKESETMTWLHDWLPVGSGKRRRVLCIGCADGAEVKALNELGYAATGITIGANNVEYGKKEYGNIDIREMDMHDLEFRPKSFDYAYSSHSFEHAFAPWIHIMEIWTVLKEGGLWFLEYPAYVEGTTDTTMLSHHHPNVLRSEEHKHMFEECGFEVLRSVNNTGREEKFLLRKSENNPMHDAIRTAYRVRSEMFV
jgi:SAM-dependent methyltransferase